MLKSRGQPRIFLKKSLGQHFLADMSVLEMEAEYAQPSGKTVLEIGAGDGRLTEELLRHSPKKLIAVEKDRRFAELLLEKFADAENVEIVNADFLEYAREASAESKKFDVVIGNIPYLISSPIIFALKEVDFGLAVLCLQKEFAERMLAEEGTPDYSRLTVMSRLHFTIELIARVPRSAFEPPPKVDSAIIALRPTKKTIDKFSEELISCLFQHKRKSARNAFADSSSRFGMGKQEARRLMEKVKNSGRRVITLGTGELLALSAELKAVLEAEGRAVAPGAEKIQEAKR